MTTIAVWLSKAWIAVALVAVGMVSVAPEAVDALGPSDTGTPPAPAFDRLQRGWTREQTIYGRLGRFFDTVDSRLAKGQNLIDTARANGKDVTSLQEALNAFTSAVTQARPAYESGKDILAAHRGFDANGNVVDAAQAFQSTWDLRLRIQEIRQTIMPHGKVLREAIRAFRYANRPAITPTPAGG